MKKNTKNILIAVAIVVAFIAVISIVGGIMKNIGGGNFELPPVNDGKIHGSVVDGSTIITGEKTDEDFATEGKTILKISDDLNMSVGFSMDGSSSLILQCYNTDSFTNQLSLMIYADRSFTVKSLILSLENSLNNAINLTNENFKNLYFRNSDGSKVYKLTVKDNPVKTFQKLLEIVVKAKPANKVGQSNYYNYDLSMYFDIYEKTNTGDYVISSSIAPIDDILFKVEKDGAYNTFLTSSIWNNVNIVL